MTAVSKSLTRSLYSRFSYDLFESLFISQLGAQGKRCGENVEKKLCFGVNKVPLAPFHENQVFQVAG